MLPPSAIGGDLRADDSVHAQISPNPLSRNTSSEELADGPTDGQTAAGQTNSTGPEPKDPESAAPKTPPFSAPDSTVSKCSLGLAEPQSPEKHTAREINISKSILTLQQTNNQEWLQAFSRTISIYIIKYPTVYIIHVFIHAHRCIMRS